VVDVVVLMLGVGVGVMEVLVNLQLH
jgi:hypothetical protein